MNIQTQFTPLQPMTQHSVQKIGAHSNVALDDLSMQAIKGDFKPDYYYNKSLTPTSYGRGKNNLQIPAGTFHEVVS